MSNSATEPRRGARARKQVDRFAPPNGKRAENGNDSDDSDLTDLGEDERPAARKRKANGTRAPRPAKRVKAPKTVPAADVEPVEGFKHDSSLFNALLQPDVAIEPLVDDWVHAYQGAADDANAEKAAVHELVVFLIRACGLTADVDEDEAVDLDGTGEAIDRIQEESVKHNAATYPLIAKAKILKPFKGNLSSVVQHLVASLQLSGLIYEDNESTSHSQAIMPLLLAWLGSMSSSPLRSIRHTSTFVGLKMHSALCDAAAQVSKDLSVKQRQKEAEAKKSGAAAKKRVNDAEDKVKESHAHKVRLEEHMKEIFDVIFIHRLRDTDPAIRTDCVRELGVWVKKFPEKYATNTYLNYFVRGSNDPDGSARLETVKALSGLFSNASLANNASSFTLRLAPRLIKMAALDIETSVRTNAINVITLIDKTGALQDEMEEDREKVARLVFDDEPRVRKAAAGFVQNLWEERAENLQAEWKSLRAGKKKRAANVKEKELEDRLHWKALATLLVQTAQGLQEADEGPSASQPDLTTIPRTNAITRAEAAADGLWPQLSEKQGMLADYLLLDHSTSEQDMWLLTDEEEDYMLGMLIACIKKEDDDDEDDERTKWLMADLPRLFTKHQAEPSRIAGILSIPEHMNLQLYLDMRKTPAYEALWTDVTNQFLKHTDPAVLQAAIRTINKLVENSTMEATNTPKLAELEEAIFASLRDAVNGEDVFGMQLDDDAAALIEAILLRVSLLARSRDLTSTMIDEEGGQSSGWAIIAEFAKRGGLGFKHESKLVATALKILLIQIGWLVRRFSVNDAEDEAKVDALRERQQEAFDIFEKFGIGGGRATEAVRREAFQAFIYLHTMFSPKNAEQHAAAKACPLEMKTDRQHKLGGAFQAAVERYASDRDEEEDEDELSFAAAQRDVAFLELVSAFVGALCNGVIDVEQAKEPLTHYGRFGGTYDQLVKKLVDVLRDEGIYNGEATTVQHVIGQALQNSFGIFLDGDDDEPEATIGLARLGASSFVIQGLHFAVLKQIHPDDVYDLHIQNLDWLFKKIGVLVKQQAAKDTKDAKARVHKQRTRVLTYFRALSLLLGPVTGRDALRIRNQLEKAADACGASTHVRSSPAYRAYEKRLVAIAGKDTGLKVAPKKAAAKPSSKSAEVIDDSDEEMETEAVNGGHVGEESQHGDESQQDDEEQQEPDEEQDEPEEPDEEPEEEPEERIEPMDEDEEDDDATPTKARPETTPKRRRDGSSLPDLDLHPGDINDDEIDLAFDDLPELERERERSRSVSIEPTAKRRKTTKRY